MSKDCIIIRGVPGSGKTTIAEIMKGDTGVVCTSDDFLMENGEYNWSPERAKEAHRKNQDLAENVMKIGISPVIIANTNTSPWEWEPYIKSAKKYGYKVHYIIVENRHGGKDIHNVPKETIEKMKNKIKNNIQL